MYKVKTQKKCVKAYLTKQLRINSKGKPYVKTKTGNIKCQGELVCFIKLPVIKTKRKKKTKK